MRMHQGQNGMEYADYFFIDVYLFILFYPYGSFMYTFVRRGYRSPWN